MSKYTDPIFSLLALLYALYAAFAVGLLLGKYLL